METVRETYHSDEYEAYYDSLDERIKEKYDYVEQIIRTQYVVSKKFIKNLEGTEFYEARISPVLRADSSGSVQESHLIPY